MEKIDQAKEFLKEARGEIKRITWPTREQAMSVTWVVIAMSVAFSVFFGLADFALSSLMKYILK
ncbi:MAG TPA: preprotein translocase subunit SecE [Thermodesulfobacteriota bacterium]|nr:preprotein translocase subunit SecE [Thermodesulfobacteriota bacterium]